MKYLTPRRHGRHARRAAEVRPLSSRERTEPCRRQSPGRSAVRRLPAPPANEADGAERVRRCEFSVLTHLTQIGRLLIALRIAQGLTPRELAERLGISESLVSRDERNE